MLHVKSQMWCAVRHGLCVVCCVDFPHRSRAGSFVRGNGVQSAPRQRRESNAAGGGLASSVDAAPWQRRSAGEPVWSSRAPLGTPDSAGRSPGLGGPPPSDTPSDQLGRRQAERERRRMGYNA